MVKRQSLKAIKKHRLSINKPEQTEINIKMFVSEFSVTDNSSMALFGADNVQKYLEQKKINSFETFLLTEENLDIKINRNKLLEPIEKGEMVAFESVGQASKEVVEWFLINFPNCVFFPIIEWFGQKVNTLVCVLGNPHGKPVGVVKTSNERK
jgi:hypothetical protein